MDPLSTINKLIELAVAESATQEEARTAALTAVKLIRKHQVQLSRQTEPARAVAFGSVSWDEFLRSAVRQRQTGNPFRADRRPGENDQAYARREVHIPEPSDFWHDQPSPPDNGVWATLAQRTRCAKCRERVGPGDRVYVDLCSSKVWCGSCA